MCSGVSCVRLRASQVPAGSRGHCSSPQPEAASKSGATLTVFAERVDLGQPAKVRFLQHWFYVDPQEYIKEFLLHSLVINLDVRR